MLKKLEIETSHESRESIWNGIPLAILLRNDVRTLTFGFQMDI